MGLGHGDALPGEIEVSNHGPAAALRIGIDGEDRECNGPDHLTYGNGGEVVIHAGDAGVGEGKVKSPGYYAGVGAGDPRAALAAEINSRAALTGVDRRNGMVSVQSNQ
jgi:hypothetical protein